MAENILNRKFIVDKPNEKMVSDVTYLWTFKGWLYGACIMDLCGQKIVGLSMSERMTKELVINELNSACIRARSPKVSYYIPIEGRNIALTITKI